MTGLTVAIFLLSLLQLEPSSAGKPSVDYEYHLLVDDEIDEEIEEHQNETDYSWIYDDFTSCSVTCGGGKHYISNFDYDCCSIYYNNELI